MAHPWQSAASFAAHTHKNQTRKDGKTPYFAHPCRVALTITAIFGCSDPTLLTAALLHDVIEDSPTDYDDVEAAFGRPVADIVAALTKNQILRESARERDYDQRLAAAGWRAIVVKLADCYDNYSDAGTTARRKSARMKSHRALKLAAPHAARPEVARGIAALRALLAARKKTRRSP